METKKTTEAKWYAVYTRPRWEKKVAEILTRKKIENYCPLNKVVRQWSDRKKIEIDCIKKFLNDYNNVQVEKTPININATVRITQGPLMEYEGNVIAIKNKTVKIVLPSLGYSLIAEVEKTNVKVISNSGPYEVNYKVGT